MTTIAYRDGIIASDSAVFGGGLYQHDGVKLFRCGDNIVGGAGDYESVFAFVEWIRGGAKKEDKPDVGEHFEGVVINPQFAKWYGKLLFGTPQPKGYWAVGCGGHLALAAMDAGATAEQAVQIAIKRDSSSGGEVVVMKVDP